MKRFWGRYKYQFTLFFIAVVPRIILNIFAYPVRTGSDEIATISNGAFFAGYDWSEVVSHAGYYGSGMTILFSPLIRFIKDSVWLYRTMLICESVFYGISALICNYIMLKIIGIKDKKYCCLVSGVCTYVVAVRTMVVYNEHLLQLLVWLLVLVILKACKNLSCNKRTIKNTVICVLIIVYAQIVHTRAIIFWIALFMVILVGRVVYKKWILSLPLLCTAGLLGRVVSTKFIEFMKSSIWLKQGEESLRNSAIETASIIDVLSPRTWHAWGNIILGQINTINILTCGIFLVTIIAFFSLFRIQISEWKQRKIFKYREQNCHKLMLILGTFSFTGIVVTILGQVFSWGIWATDGMSLGIPSYSYGLKGFTYIRYFVIYCGPLIMMFFAWIYLKRDWFRKWFKTIFITFILLQLYWFMAIIPYIYKNGTLTEVFIPFSLWNESREIGISLFLPASIICCILLITFYFLYKKKKIYLPLIIVGMVLIFQYIYNGIVYDYNNSLKTYSLADSGYDLIQKMEKQIELPEDIYVFDGSGKEDHQNFYIYQFLLKEYHIIPKLPKESNDDLIVFSDQVLEEEMLKMGYQYAQLDDNEYIYIKGKVLQEIVENCGVRFSSYK